MITRNTLQRKFQHHLPQIIGMEQKAYSVLIPFIQRKGELHIVLEKRSGNISQPGEISFPGGRMDISDKNLKETAVRETMEELGIKREDINVISAFNILAPPFNKVIYSYLAELSESSLFDINKQEVEKVLFIPFSHFLLNAPDCYDGKVSVERPDHFPFEKIPFQENYPFAKGNYHTCFYQYGDITIWGLTAALIKSLVESFEYNND